MYFRDFDFVGIIPVQLSSFTKNARNSLTAISHQFRATRQSVLRHLLLTRPTLSQLQSLAIWKEISQFDVIQKSRRIDFKTRKF